MTRHRLEVADVFQKYGSDFLRRYGSSLSIEQRRVFDAVVSCRTKVLGGHLESCDDCGHQRNAYNSCRNRHCPKCQGMEQARWMEARVADSLPIPYFHVTFTLPKEIGPIALQNKRVVYGILFQAAAETLRESAADPKHLGAEIGILAVLHTWGQKLESHPHIHCVVTGGGINGSRWVACKRTRAGSHFFVPGQVLARVFMGKFLHYLKRAYQRGELGFHGQLASLALPAAFEQRLNASVRKNWVVDVRAAGSSENIVKYLARYVQRIAISNSRLLTMQNGKVRFRYKDYADGGKQKLTQLDATEFIRRFLLHVVPRGFMRIRHYGFLANCHRRKKLKLCRQLLGVAEHDKSGDEQVLTESTDLPRETENTKRLCPACGKGKMVKVKTLEPTTDESFERLFTLARSPPLQRSA